MEIDWEATRGAVVLFGGLGVVATAVLALIVKDGKNAEELRNQRFHYIAQRWGLEAAHRFIHKRVQVGDSVEFVQLTLGRATYIDRKVTARASYETWKFKHGGRIFLKLRFRDGVVDGYES